MSHRALRAAALLAGALAFTGAGAQPADLEPVPEPPPMPEPVRSGEVLEPDITIIQGERQVIHEYRYNGRLYAVKVIPEGGKPYFLVDADGDGELETRRKELGPQFAVPAWVLFSW